MHNARFRLMSGLAGATLCLFAAASYGQTPTTTTGSPNAQAQGTQPSTTTGNAATPAPTDQGTTNDAVTRTTATDVSTTNTTWTFPGGTLGILAVAVIVLLVLFAVFRGRDRTVIRETSTSSSAASPAPRNVGPGTAAGDRSLNPRTASGTGTNTGGTSDPNARL